MTLTVAESSAQSGWKPDLRPNRSPAHGLPGLNSAPQDLSDIRRPDFPNLRAPSGRRLKSDNPYELFRWLRVRSIGRNPGFGLADFPCDTTTYHLAFNLLRFVPLRAMFSGGASASTPASDVRWRDVISDSAKGPPSVHSPAPSYTESDNTEEAQGVIEGRETRLASENAHSSRGPFWRGFLYRTVQYASLDRFNSIFLKQELGMGDHRNHQSLHTGSGAGFGIEMFMSAQSGMRLVLEVTRHESVDRETWLETDEQTGQESYPRDEQKVSIETTAYAAEFFYQGRIDRVSWKIHGGPQVLHSTVAVQYHFDGNARYSFESDPTAGFGALAGLTLSVPVVGPLTAEVAAGMRIVRDMVLSAGGLEWHWSAANGQSTRAALEMSGMFWRVGLGTRL